MTKTEWMKQNGICSKSFYYWQRKLRTELSADIVQKNLALSQHGTVSQLPDTLVFIPAGELQPVSGPSVYIWHGNAVIEIQEGIPSLRIYRSQIWS